MSWTLSPENGWDTAGPIQTPTGFQRQPHTWAKEAKAASLPPPLLSTSLYIYIYICVHRHSSVFNILIHCLYFLNISNVFAICPTWLLWGAIHSGQPKHDLVRTDNHKTPWSIETWARLRAGGQPGLRLCFVYLVCTIYPYIGICIYICIYVLYIELYLFEKCSYILIDIHMFVYFPTCS